MRQTVPKTSPFLRANAENWQFPNSPGSPSRILEKYDKSCEIYSRLDPGAFFADLGGIRCGANHCARMVSARCAVACPPRAHWRAPRIGRRLVRLHESEQAVNDTGPGPACDRCGGMWLRFRHPLDYAGIPAGIRLSGGGSADSRRQNFRKQCQPRVAGRHQDAQQADLAGNGAPRQRCRQAGFW